MLLLLAAAAQAYETDQLTDRHVPLDDITVEANARIDAILGEAIAWTNRTTACAANDEQTRALLAHAVHARTAPDIPVAGRGPLRSAGFDIYGAWLESSDLERRSFADRRDLYSRLSVRESAFLRFAGTCSTVRIAGELVGTDKLDHFFEEGYNSWMQANRGEEPLNALVWTAHTERTIYGMYSSKTFSFGDLRADWDGYRFYDGLLSEGSVARRGPDGCVAQQRPWDWGEWVTWEYDEVLNPSVHTRQVQKGITRVLRDHRDEYCTSYARWGGPAYQEHLRAVLSETPEYVVGDVPRRTDPYQLAELCAGWAGASASGGASAGGGG